MRPYVKKKEREKKKKNNKIAILTHLRVNYVIAGVKGKKAL